MKTKSQLVVCVAATLLSFQAVQANILSESFICEGGEEKKVEQTTAESKKRSWTDRLKEQLKGSDLKYSLNLPTAHLADFDFDFGVTRESSKTISGNYSQADLWKLGVGSDIIDGDDGGTGRFGLYGSITYVRQFKTRAESICKDVPWYDPREKVPQSAADFDMVKNAENALKPGDLIQFQTELVLGVPEWMQSKLKIMSPVSMEGRFTVQIFRMTENLVRVRVSATQDKAARAGFKYRILDLPGALGRRTEIEVMLHEILKSEMAVIDTVFNLDPALNANKKAKGLKTAHELYDTLIGAKMQLELKNWAKLAWDAIKTNLPLYDKYRNKIMNELNQLKEASILDSQSLRDNLVATDRARRVYLISQANAEGVKRSGRLGAGFFNIFKASFHNYDYESFMSVTDSTHKTNNFLLHGIGRLSQWKVLKLFGKSMNVSTNLVLRAPENIDPREYDNGNAVVAGSSSSGEFGYDGSQQNVRAPKLMPLTGIYGFQLTRGLKDQSFKAKEAKQLVKMLEDQLTDHLFDKVIWRSAKDADKEDDKVAKVDPNWEAFTSREQENVELSQDIIFKESIFNRYNKGAPVSQAYIERQIKTILRKKASNLEMLKATPVVAARGAYSGNGEGGGGSEAPEMSKKRQRKYTEAYAQDIVEIAGFLTAILNSDDTRSRYENYKTLTTYELFMEIGGIIMMYVNEQTLATDVAVKVVLGAQNREPIIGYYPSKKAYDDLKVFGAVVNYQNQLTDRSYNLRNFFDEGGNIISLRNLLLTGAEVNMAPSTENSGSEAVQNTSGTVIVEGTAAPSN